jgi:hypothetical protein
MNDSTPVPTLSADQIEAVGEINVLASILAEQYKAHVEVYIKELKMTPQDAQAKAAETHPTAVQRAMSLTPRDMAWLHIADLQRADPELAVRRWNEIKATAREELASGHYATDWGDSPFARAQFLAVRHAFKVQWQPQNEGEQLLVDMLAQLFLGHLEWLHTLQRRATLAMKMEEGEVKRTGKWKAQRVTEAEAIEAAGMMVERFSRLFTRTLRSIRDLRRFSLNVNITNPHQVNVAGVQQNLAQVQAPTSLKADEPDE